MTTGVPGDQQCSSVTVIFLVTCSVPGDLLYSSVTAGAPDNLQCSSVTAGVHGVPSEHIVNIEV